MAVVRDPDGHLVCLSELERSINPPRSVNGMEFVADIRLVPERDGT